MSPNQIIIIIINFILQVLIYTAGHINYGGRVTDDWDRRCLMNILSDFYSSKVISDEHVYSDSGEYKQIDTENDQSVNSLLLYSQ